MNDTQSILDPLNPAQREAVTAIGCPVLVNAGAGSGKTRVITHRIAWLIREAGVPPWQIFASTFTNKAAAEMKHRIARLLPGIETARLTVGTFHAICVGILRREAAHLGLDTRFTIADESDQLALVKDCIKTLNLPKAIDPKQTLGWISAAKTKMYTPDEAAESLEAEWGPEYSEVYRTYDERLRRNNAVDFDDLLGLTVKLFQENEAVRSHYRERWRHLLVDEYQDINHVQFELIRLLAGAGENLCVVGDEDQSIYSWRGAEIENIIDFPEMFPETRTIRLEQNYRSSGTILEASNAVIRRNRMRLGKDLWSDRGAGEPIVTIEGVNERDEAAQVVETILWHRRALGTPWRDMAIFYRINALSRLYEDFLRQAGVPYRVVGGIRFYDRAEIKDLLAYLRLIVNPADGVSLTRIVNKPRRGIGDKTLTKLFADASARGVTLWEQLGAAIEENSLSKKAGAGAGKLIRMIHNWRAMAENSTPPELLDAVLRDTQYEESLGDPRALETLTRKENIEELRRALEDFVKESPDGTLEEYLENVALTAAVDEMSENEDCVSLMTLHSAKGLEFPAVFLTGMEEGIFPSPRALSENGNLEEERRLFYVGVTRTRDRLFLSRSDSRSLYGRTQYNPPSLFLMEIPKELTQSLEAWRLSTSERKSPTRRSAMLGERSEGASFRESAPPAAEGRADETPGLFPPGARVRHATLGEGEVLAVRGEGDRRKISIKFDAGLQLEVLEQYGGLEAAEDGDLPF